MLAIISFITARDMLDFSTVFCDFSIRSFTLPSPSELIRFVSSVIWLISLTQSLEDSRLFLRLSTSLLASCVLSACFTAPSATLEIASATCPIVLLVSPAISEI